MSYKKTYIDRVILSAKTGNRESLLQLKGMFSFLCDDIFLKISEMYPVLKTNKFSTYYSFHIAFWQTINEYRFDSGDLFSTILTRQIIKSCIVSAGRETVLDSNYIMSLFRKEKIKDERIIALQCFKRITSKQAQAILYYIYMGNSLEKTAELIGILIMVCVRRIKLGYNRINRGVRIVKSKLRKVEMERIYKIREVKRLEES